ncbi:MAG: heme-binding domain-containing protein, partial [Bilophila sp.]
MSIPTNRSESAFVPLVLFTEVTQVLREKCMPCHTWNYTVPLYGKIPGLDSLVERDYKEGLRHVNFAAELSPGGQGKAVNEVFLAKVERTLADKRMPPPQYISAYLSAQLNASERDLLQTWVHQTRLTCYATGLASPEFATEPVQPLPDAVPVDNRKVDLGARLFFDTRLSGNNAMTCASC